ncbi:MAG: NPCBM/NEW2 domain-containing protein, partial [Fibrobacterota bacterium]
KAVLPFEVRGEHVPERVLYQVNRKGKGWVISLYNNAGRETFMANGPEKVWLEHRVDVEIAVAPEITHAVEWISRDRVGIIRENEKQAGVLRIGLDPGEVRVVEIQPEDIPPAQVVERVNLALNRPVKASSFCTDHGPELAVNGNRDIYDAWWSKEYCTPKTPQWLEVDLGAVKKINSINTIFMWSEDNQILQRVYQYYVETSVDGQTWNKVFDESENMMPAHPRGHHRFFDPVDARYVRITTTMNTAISGAQIVEFEVYGDEKAPRIYNWKKTPPLRTTSGKATFPDGIAQAKEVKYLSDLQPKFWKQGYMQLAFDKDMYKGGPISIRGHKFTKGLGTHAYSEIIYDLASIPGGWRYFAASVGIDDSSTPDGTVDFVIFVDGVEKARTGRTTMSDAPYPVWVSLEGAKELKLGVEDCGDGLVGDIADWAEARLVK